MPGRNPRQGDIYQHFKGNKYQVTAIAVDAETQEKCVVYQALYGDYVTYVRKYSEFVSEVDKEKYPQVRCKYRFSSAEEIEGDAEEAAAEVIEAETKGATEEIENREPAPGYEMHELKHPEDEGEVNPVLLAFLDAGTIREKIEILERAGEELTESVLCAIEASMDINSGNDSLEERIYYVMNYLRTRERYEGKRLR